MKRKPIMEDPATNDDFMDDAPVRAGLQALLDRVVDAINSRGWSVRGGGYLVLGKAERPDGPARVGVASAFGCYCPGCRASMLAQIAEHLERCAQERAETGAAQVVH